MMASLDENCSLYLTILKSRQKRAPSNATQRDQITPGLVVQHGISSGIDLVSEKRPTAPGTGSCLERPVLLHLGSNAVVPQSCPLVNFLSPVQAWPFHVSSDFTFQS